MRLGDEIGSTPSRHVAPSLASVHFGNEPELVTEMKQLEVALNHVAGNATEGGGARAGLDLDADRPVPKARTVQYSDYTCRTKFAYADARKLCRRLQERTCGKNCTRIVNNTNFTVKECKSVQKTLCGVRQAAPVPEPIKVGEVPKGPLYRTLGSGLRPAKKPTPVVATVCNARPGNPSQIWVAVLGEKAPRAVVPELPYLNCTQLAGWSGLEIRAYTLAPSGKTARASYTLGDRNSILLLGESGLDDSENVIFRAEFQDEGYKRPILCNGAYAERTHLKVTVEGRKWYPFVIRGDKTKDRPEGKIAYLECELLALDHVDSLQREETLELWSGKKPRAEVPVNPVIPLFFLGSTGPAGKEALTFKEINLGQLKYNASTPK